LTGRERTAILLRDVEGLAAEDVAAHLNCSKATVRSHIRQCSSEIKTVFGKKEVMSRHIAETELALYASGDLALWRRASVRMHIGRCDRCREVAAQYQARRTQLHELANEVPEGLDWDRLAVEMTANIHVGLAAGECVAHRTRKRTVVTGWRSMALVSGVAAGMVLLIAGGFWLNSSGRYNEIDAYRASSGGARDGA